MHTATIPRRHGTPNQWMELSELLSLLCHIWQEYSPFPTGPLWVSRSSAQFEPDGGLSGLSVCDLTVWEADGEAGSEGSSCQEELSVLDFNRSLEPSFFGLISLTRALAPIQWFFLVRRILGVTTHAHKRQAMALGWRCGSVAGFLPRIHKVPSWIPITSRKEDGVHDHGHDLIYTAEAWN